MKEHLPNWVMGIDCIVVTYNPVGKGSILVSWIDFKKLVWWWLSVSFFFIIHSPNFNHCINYYLIIEKVKKVNIQNTRYNTTSEPILEYFRGKFNVQTKYQIQQLLHQQLQDKPRALNIPRFQPPFPSSFLIGGRGRRVPNAAYSTKRVEGPVLECGGGSREVI